MIEGRIELVPAPAQMEADVHVWVEDTTYLDSRAERVVGMVQRVRYGGDPAGIAFALNYTPARPDGRTYTLAALVDLDGDGKPGRGDYVSYEAIGVPRDGSPVVLRVRRIG